ncbi:MAG: DUF1801 domain-containing protein [Gemmatimonadetes bacterium]|nr:DUF1801 domain-containing protein [Gemmatimonadota bacterium]
MPKMKAYASFDDYLRDQSSRNQAIIRALRRFVKSAEPQLMESVKWGNGCWLAGTEPVAYVYSDAAWVQFGFLTGSSLTDPGGLLEGTGRYVRHIKVRKPGDIDRPAFGALLKQATSRRRSAPKRKIAARKA